VGVYAWRKLFDLPPFPKPEPEPPPRPPLRERLLSLGQLVMNRLHQWQQRRREPEQSADVPE
jgi:hypothetical protein